MPAKSRLCAIAAIGALLASASCAAQEPPGEPEEKITYKTEELFAHGAYRFLVEQKYSQSPDEAEPLAMEQMLIVRKDGREIDRRKGWRWEADGPAEDITGDGVPDIVLTDYSGGAHCCTTYYIFELREILKVHELDVGDFAASFEQKDGSPALEIVTSDTKYTYWRAPFVSSARPTVVLRYRDGAYEPAPDLMRAPPPSQAEMAQWAKEANDEGWDMKTLPRGSDNALDLGGAFLNAVTDLIYTGHADMVPSFVDLAWPAAKSGKQDFIEELMECRIRKSRYWPAVAAMNGLPADQPIGECWAEDG